MINFKRRESASMRIYNVYNVLFYVNLKYRFRRFSAGVRGRNMGGGGLTVFLLGHRNAWHSINSLAFVAMKAKTCPCAASAEQYEILKQNKKI